MRIITGRAKGCKLKTPKGFLTRPTADRVKESLFNILGSTIFDTKVLDLFAGSGNLGLEALSRGAECVTFVDQNTESIGVIKENAIHTKLVDSVEILKNDVFSALHKLDKLNRTFNLIFCDPPYNQGYVKKILENLDRLSLVEKGGIVVVEHSLNDKIDFVLENLELKRSQRYGTTVVSFFICNRK